jgi:L-ornithine N5-monooxygenase
LLEDARTTNYGVVRLELIEQLYELMYDQRREYGIDESKWPHRIMGGWYVGNVDPLGDDLSDRLRLRIRQLEGFSQPNPIVDATLPTSQELDLNVDLIIAATGYQRNAHLEMLKDAWTFLPESRCLENGVTKSGLDGWQVSDCNSPTRPRKLEVGRDYQVKFAQGSVASGSGIWLQGCCEGTHGVSLNTKKRSWHRSFLRGLSL